MRLICAVFALGAMMIGGANASSFVVVGPPKTAPSIVVLGSPQTSAVAKAAETAPRSPKAERKALASAKATRGLKTDRKSAKIVQAKSMDVTSPAEPATAATENASIAVPLAFPLPSEEPAPRIVQVSASIVAYSSPEPAVTFEKVAGIRRTHSDWGALPKVIRGGISDEGVVRAAAPVAPEAKPIKKAGAGQKGNPRLSERPQTLTAPDGRKITIRVAPDSGASKAPPPPPTAPRPTETLAPPPPRPSGTVM